MMKKILLLVILLTTTTSLMATGDDCHLSTVISITNAIDGVLTENQAEVQVMVINDGGTDYHQTVNVDLFQYNAEHDEYDRVDRRTSNLNVALGEDAVFSLTFSGIEEDSKYLVKMQYTNGEEWVYADRKGLFTSKAEDVELNDRIIVNDFTIRQRKTIEIPVVFDNPDHDFIMLEFWLSLPSGIDIAKDDGGEPLCEPSESRFKRSHQLVVDTDADGSYHFLIYSTRNEVLKGNSGTLFTMTVKAAPNVTPGTNQGRVFGMLFSDADKHEYHPHEVPFNVTVLESSDSEGQTLTLVKGWNWVSSYLQEPLPLAQLKEKCSRIVGQEQELIRDPQFGMTGGLTTLESGKAYKVLADEAVTLTFSGQLHDGTTDCIELKKGWNWMAYPCGEAKSIAAAITNAEAGDRIVSQDGTTATYNGSSWTGTLTLLKPGQGYLYKSFSAKQLFFNF